MTIEDRLRKGATIKGPDDCWDWHKSCMTGGYGNFRSGAGFGAHRAAFFVWKNASQPIPEGVLVCHTCDNRKCINPNHLYAGDHTTNVRDMVERGRSRGAAKGSRHHKAKLTEELVGEIRSLYDAGGVTHAGLAKRFNVGRSTISRVCGARDRFWTHVK